MEEKLRIRRFPCGIMQANCYIVDDGKSAVVIDIGLLNDNIKNIILADNLKVEYVLLTHRHFDHLCGVNDLLKVCDAKVAISEKDACGLWCDEDNMRLMCNNHYPPANTALKPTIIISENSIIDLPSMSFEVIETPGHTEGGVCYLLNDKYLFSGDTLFEGSVGRTDFPTGDYSILMSSLDKLKKLGDDILVYPGHGEITSIGREKKYNPYMGI